MNLSALLKHPRVFYFVFIIEILERFSYYGVSSMIGLYAVQSLGLSQEEMAVIFDAFLILLFLPIFIGGYLSDQFIGEKRSILLGLVLLAAGYCSLAFTSAHFFFLSLSLILVGNMFYKTTPASLLAKSVLKEKKTMDSIFTLYYMAINVGSFIGMASFQIMFAHSNLKIAFLTGFAGVILAFLVSLGFYQFIQCKAVKPLSSKNLYGIFVLIIAAIALFNYSLQLPWLLHCVEVVLFVAVIMLFLKKTYAGDFLTRKRALVIGILMLEALVYFIPNWYTPLTLSFFSSHFASSSIFGFEINSKLFQTLNPFWIFALSPLLASYYVVQDKKGKDANITTKFATGILFCAVGFLLIPMGYFLSAEGGQISADWVAIAYICLALGELLVSGLGLSMIARLSDPDSFSFMMGFWYVAPSVAICLRDILPRTPDYIQAHLNTEAALYLYSRQFLILGVTVLFLSILMFIFSEKLAGMVGVSKKSQPSIKNAIQVTESLSSKLSKKVSRHLLVIGLAIAMTILIGTHSISKKMYDTQVNTWVTYFSQTAASNLALNDDTNIPAEVNILKVSGLFSSFVVMNTNGNLISGFGLRHSFINEIVPPPDEMKALSAANNYQIHRIIGGNSQVLGYYAYSTDYDDYFVPFLWLTALCLFAIIFLYFVFKNVLRYGFNRDLGKLGSFLMRVETLTQSIKTEDQINAELPIDPHNASEEELRINKIFSELVAEINSSHNQIKEITQQAEQDEAKKVLGKVTAQVVHDIRSPLAALKTQIKALPHVPEAQRIAIRNAVNSVTDIANNLLAQHKGLAADQAVTYKIWLLAPLIESTISEKRVNLDEEHIELDSEITDAGFSAFAQCDSNQIKRILSNLINNASEAFDPAEKGHITVTLDATKSNIELAVIDNGAGIPSEQLTKILEWKGSTSKESGNGIGLMHAKEMVESWGGDFVLTSEVGKGTKVTLSLPPAKAPDWFVSEIRVSLAVPIGILDDYEPVHDAWKQRLSEVSKDLQVHHFTKAQTFIDWYQAQTTPVQVFSDYELVGDTMMGLDVLEKLEVGQNGLLVTSHDEDPAIMERCQKRGIRLLPKNLLTHVPIILRKEAAEMKKYDLVLLDDTPMVTDGWEVAAMGADKDILVFNTVEALEDALAAIDPATPIYIDSELGNGIKGEEYAESLFKRGFKELYLATGHEPEHFGALPWIKGIVGKEFPSN